MNNPTADFDLAVVGAGPAGVAAAVSFQLRAPRLRVVLLERARFPRDKPCGGAMTGLALDELAALDLLLRVPTTWPSRAVVRTAAAESGVSVNGRCVVARRVELDRDLALQAVERGIVLQQDCAVREVKPVGSAFAVATSQGLLSARAVISCTGVSGLGRRASNMPDGEKARLREAWSGPAPDPDSILFDFTATTGGLRGYTWTFPCGDESNVGAYHLPARGACARLDTVMDDHAARERLVTRDRIAYSLRCFDSAAATGVPGLLLAGEEVGADPLTGEGISYALWSGRLAGEEAAWSLTRNRAPDPQRLRARMLGSAPGRALVLLSAMARRLYGPHGADYLRLVGDATVAEGLADLVIRRAEPMRVAARLLPVWLRERWSGRI